MSEFTKGDYVVHINEFGDGDYGRVASVVDGGRVFVCFTSGCTASACDPAHLRRVEPRAWMGQVGFGYHRFDDECPDYDPEFCAAYCPEKGGER